MLVPNGETMTAFVMADASGKIVGSGNIPARMLSIQKPPVGGSRVLGNGTGKTHHIADGVITERKNNTTTLSGMRLLSIPNPSTVTIDGENACVVTDGEVDLSFTQPGTYTVLVSSFPALDATFQVTQP